MSGNHVRRPATTGSSVWAAPSWCVGLMITFDTQMSSKAWPPLMRSPLTAPSNLDTGSSYDRPGFVSGPWRRHEQDELFLVHHRNARWLHESCRGPNLPGPLSIAVLVNYICGQLLSISGPLKSERMSFLQGLKTRREIIAPSDPWLPPPRKLKGESGYYDRTERVGTEAVFEYLGVPPFQRTPAAAQRLRGLMVELGWTPVRSRQTTSKGIATRVRGYARLPCPDARQQVSAAED